ncbi:MAG: enoyl-CoA hydratase/isomerase family protein [Candidatus Lambdaproteobacteria bacterium]|nr:enoyl-CoA hydratase/isomerase family protein [Candidatus Lambdaproteobacteria bacterium]
MTQYKDILFSIKDYVCTITINRPKALNAFTGDTIKELEDAVLSTYHDKSIGVVVLTGTGDRAFSAGGDVRWEAAGGLEDSEWRLGRYIVECPKPVIARVPGYAIGGGNHLAYCCDFTIAAEHARFGQTGPRVGSPATGYPVSHSANIIGHKRAREMWMLTRQYTAQQMLAWGLVNSVVPMDKLDEEVAQWCKELLALSPTCLKVLKEAFRIHMEPILKDKMVDIVNRVAPGYHASGEQQEGAAAFLEKRPPDFARWR